MTALALIASLGTLLAAGAGITFLLSAGGARLNVAEGVCLAWLFGVGAVSLLLWLCGSFASGTVLQLLVTAICLALAIGGLKIFRDSGGCFHCPRPANWFEWILAIILASQIATIFYASCKHTLGWDGLLVWEIKARYAFLSDGVLPGAYFKHTGRAFSHPDYPLALPFAQLWIYLWLGDANQFWAKIISPIFYSVGAVLLALLCRRLTDQRWLGYVAGILLYFVPQLSVGAGGALVSYVDLPLGVVYLATIGYLLCFLIGEPSYFFRVYALCLALLPWLKREGAILWLVAAIAGVVVIAARRRSWLALLALSPGLALIGCWQIFLRTVHAVPSSDFLPLSFNTFRANLDRVLPIYRAALAEMMSLSDWSIFWFLTAAACLYLLWRLRRLQSSLLLFATLSPPIIYASIYFFSSWHFYRDHVCTSLVRLQMQIVPIAWLSIGVAFASCRSAVREPAPAEEKPPCEKPILGPTAEVDLTRIIEPTA